MLVLGPAAISLTLFAYACSKDSETTDTAASSTTTTDPVDPEDRCATIKASISDAGFSDNATVECDDTYAYITSDTYPDHEVMNGIKETNEQIPVRAPGHKVPIPLAPELATSPTSIDAALAVAVNGVPIYDYSAQGELDVNTYDPNTDTKAKGQLDNCGGHAGRGDDYHYHVAPTCMIESMANKGDSAVIGWGFDGYPIYGSKNPDGSAIGSDDLDVCNGQADSTFGYRYHTSAAAPYILQCLAGKVDKTLLPRIQPLTDSSNKGKDAGTPPQGGVQSLKHEVAADGTVTMSYTYQGANYYIKYSKATKENCYNFEMKTVTNSGVVKTGEYCR
ncbi:MAG TPA: YHYH protein [Oligoflexus sp.]|uniref:YHYH protein n=1 Tax=Oligoflexus sp. TaxID=1971216 RepID=UPI002D5E33E8|nr:YHYH protein [Oligoflexus sp.]HYX36571.1 YHYH protein [Oligoflexus sp.]